MAFSVALGFDSYVIVRHGVLPLSSTKAEPTASSTISSIQRQQPSSTAFIPGDQLGCYFCCDVTAPGNVRILSRILYISSFSFISVVTGSYTRSTMYSHSSRRYANFDVFIDDHLYFSMHDGCRRCR